MGPTKTLNASGRSPRQGHAAEREQIIADALVGFASELRLTDAAELMSMIQNDHAANLADLVNSSTELFFKNGTLRYALSASFKAPWDATPTVEIDMEYREADLRRRIGLDDRETRRRRFACEAERGEKAAGDAGLSGAQGAGERDDVAWHYQGGETHTKGFGRGRIGEFKLGHQ